MKDLYVTIDIDWAPDCAIDFTASILSEAQVPATWFITHDSPAVRRLKERNDLFEVGFHPNFLANSTQGDTEESIIDFCSGIAPKAQSFRMHGLYQYTGLLDKIVQTTGARIDCSLYLPNYEIHEPVSCQYGSQSYIRVPHNWEDDCEMMKLGQKWDVEEFVSSREGVGVFDFHPLHVFLNTNDMVEFRKILSSAPASIDERGEFFSGYSMSGKGTQTFFRELVDMTGGSYGFGTITNGFGRYL